MPREIKPETQEERENRIAQKAAKIIDRLMWGSIGALVGMLLLMFRQSF